MNGDGHLEGPADVLAALAAAGVASVADVLARAEGIRDLPRRSNHVLRVAGWTLHVKRSKRRGPSPEAESLAQAAAAGVPVPRVAFTGEDRLLGAVVGTFDLAPARPFDDVLREGRLSPEATEVLVRALIGAVAALHQARLHHHDLYLNHVYVDPATPGRGVTIIDLERLTTHHGILGRAVVKDLAALEASWPDGVASCRRRARWLSDYLKARRFPAARLRGPLLRRVAAKARRIRAHAPRTPVGAAARPRLPR